MHNSETPIFPYWMKGMMRHKRSPCVHVPWANRNTLNGNTTIQNRQSATHKLQVRQHQIGFILSDENGKCEIEFDRMFFMSVIYLIMNAAATFRTFGHFNNAITVNKLPQIPTIIIRPVNMAANVSNVRLNLVGK